MESKPKVYLYHTAVRWTEERKGVISCAGKPDVEVATPPVGVALKATAGQAQLDVVVPDVVLEATAKYIKQVSREDRPEVP